MGFIYTGNNLEEDLHVPAILALTEATGPGSFLQLTGNFTNFYDFHMYTADTVNFEYQDSFTSFVPAESELGDVADVLAKMMADGEIDHVSFNAVLGGKAMDPHHNAVGDVLRKATGFEMTVNGCQTEACQASRAELLEVFELAEADLLEFETLQASVDKLDPVVRGRYVNEWISKAGYAFPSPNNFWDPQTYSQLLEIKQSVDPCNVMTVEAGVAWDLPHCKQAQRRQVVV